MLLRTVVLLLLCVPAGMCATLGQYQTQANEEEAHASASTAVTNGVVAATSVDRAKGDTVSADAQVADKPEVDVPVGEGAPVEEAATDSNGPAVDAPATQVLTEETVPQEQRSEKEEGNDIRPVQKNLSTSRPLVHEDDPSWSLNSIRNSFQTMHGYFDSLVELVGGHDGVCEYRCTYGDRPQPRPGYQLPEPNGCSSSLVGFQFDLGIPVMTKCCNQLDMCYDTCGASKYNCDSTFRLCLRGICSDLKKSLGFVSKVQACESMVDALYNTVWTLGCKPYMNSQRAACVCKGDEKDEL